MDPDDLTEDQIDALIEFAEDCDKATSQAIFRFLLWFWWPWC